MASTPDAERGTSQSDGIASVRELVRRRIRAESDTWDLALVQRAEAWDQVRMRYLLDSLLAGYPIGSILLCRVPNQASRVIRVDALGKRHLSDAARSSWQLLDGQQRINALVSLFTTEGRYGRFYLHMTVHREPPGPASRRRTKDRAMPYILWRPSEPEPDVPELDATAPVVPEPIPERDQHINLSRWYSWAEDSGANRVGTALSDLRARTRRADEILREIDPEFTAVMEDERLAVAEDRLTKLLQAWTRPSIPVLRTDVESPLDVLEVFTRINLGGVQVGGTDVYFAAVRTFWNEAESRLDQVSKATGMIRDRIGALQFVSRLASRGTGQGDILPLTVDRLAGPRGVPLIEAMRELTADDSLLVGRLKLFSSWLFANSRLGFSLRFVSSQLWDEVLGWAVTSGTAEEAWYSENLASIDAYLLGATLFRYPRVLGDRFRRNALRESLAAGVGGRPFPLQRILQVARAENHALSGSRDLVRTLGNAEDRQWTTDLNVALLLSIAQRLPYTAKNLDWDHIFPAAQASRMWAVSEYRRRMHHPYRRFVNSAGNLWALDLSTNRSLQDKPPSVKFPELIESLANRGPHRIWPRDQWSPTDHDVQRFIESDNGLTDDPVAIDRAMTTFHDLVTARAERLLNDAIAGFPGAELFAADTDLAATDPTPEVGGSLAEALRLTVTVVSHEEPAETAAPVAGSVPQPLDLGHVWAGREDELKRIWDSTTRRHTKLCDPGSRRVLPTQHRVYGFDYMRWIWLGPSHPDTHIIVGVASKFAQQGQSPLWLQITNETGGYAQVRDRLTRSPYWAGIPHNLDNLWLPIDLDPGLARGTTY